MASNSLFSTVTPCQQNFFWGEYHSAAHCCVWIGLGVSGHRKDLGSGAEVWVVRLRGLREVDEDVGSDLTFWVQLSGGDQLRSLRTPLSRSKLFVVDERPNYHQGFFCVSANAPKPKKKKKEKPKSLHIEIPVFIQCDVYKYFQKREMICLCNIRLDLQSDAIAEPKTKARVIFLTDVNRRCTREFTVEHWNKMWGLLGCVCWVPVLAHREEVLISLPRRICNRFLKLFSRSAVIN